MSYPRELSWPRVQLGGQCRRSAPSQHAHNETERVSQVQLQCKQPWGATGCWPFKLFWPRVELGGRCRLSAPLHLVYKSENEMERVSQVLRPCKQHWGTKGSWPGELSWPIVELGGRCRRPAPCGLAQNDTE